MMRVSRSNQINASAVDRILVRATNWVGDAVMTLPAVEALREVFPASRITVLAKPWVAPVFENHPAVDRVILFHKGRGPFHGLGGTLRVIQQIRELDFRMAVLFQNAFEAALLAFLGGVKFRIGYNSDGRGFLLTHSIVKTKEITEAHQVEHYLQILRAMGWEAASRDPFLYLSKEGPAKAQDLLRSRGVGPEEMLVGLGPGAVFGDAKRWPADRFAIIGDWAVQRWGARVLVMGSQGETDICNAVRASMSRNALNLCGQTTLDEAMAIVKRCHLFVTNDSGLMHVAAALGVPTVAIFGSTNPAATGPRGPQTAVVQHHVECAPCLKRRCPTDFRCLMSIPPEAVWAEMEKLRQKGASASNPSYPVEGVGDEETGRLH